MEKLPKQRSWLIDKKNHRFNFDFWSGERWAHPHLYDSRTMEITLSSKYTQYRYTILFPFTKCAINNDISAVAVTYVFADCSIEYNPIIRYTA